MNLIRSLMMLGAAILPAAATPPATEGEPALRGSNASQPVSARRTDAIGELSASLQRLAAKVSPAVVQIEVTWFGPPEDDPLDAGIVVRQHGVGAGVILDPDGYIMTNAHVVEGAQRVRVLVSLPGPSSISEPSAGRFRALEARVIGSEKRTDLALLKVEAAGLPALSINVDRVPQPGELVFAVGSPGGLRNSVTMGVVSSAWRQPDPDNPMVYLQTDAAISPGSSGGPLVDVSGAVIGLNTFMLRSPAGGDAPGFAIPARVVDFVYRSLRTYGRVDRVEIGATAQTITPVMAAGLGLGQDWGVVLADVLPRGPADRAGLLPGDIILAVDGHPIPGLPRFTAALYEHPPSQALEITASRGGRTLSFKVPALPARDRLEGLLGVPDPATSHVRPLGIMGLDLDETLRSRMPDVRIGAGVVVMGHAPGFDSVDVGLRPGDVIHSVNRTVVESVDALKAALAGLGPGDPVVLRIERVGQFQFLAFEVE